MEFTRDEVVGVYNILSGFAQEKLSVFGAKVIIKNKNLAKAEVEFLEEIKEKFKPILLSTQEYTDKRMDLCKEYCERDEEGNEIYEYIRGLRPSEETKNFVFSKENRIIFDKKLEELREEYKDTLEKNKEIEIEFKDLLQEKIDVPFVEMKIEFLPKEMTLAQFELLNNLIIDTEE